MKTRDAPVLVNGRVSVDSQGFSYGVSGAAGNLHVFQQLLNLRVVLGFDLFVIKKVLLNAGVLMNLKALLVKCILVLLASNVMDGHLEWLIWPFIGLWFPDIRWRRWASVTGVFVIVQRSTDMVLLRLGWLGLVNLSGQRLERC